MRPCPCRRKAGLLQGPALYPDGGPGRMVKGYGGMGVCVYGFPGSPGPGQPHHPLPLSRVVNGQSEPS